MPRYFMTSKAIVLEESDGGEHIFHDILKNKAKINLENFQKGIDLDTSFIIDTDNLNIDNIFKNISSNIYLSHNGVPYIQLLENSIKEIQYIELVSFQYFIKENLSEENHHLLAYIMDVMEKKREGEISAEELTNIINELKKNTSLTLVNGLLYYSHLQDLFEFIRHKFFHAEYRLKQIFIKMTDILKEKKDTLSSEIDFKHRGEICDEIGYDIEDIIKTLVTALDTMAKVLVFSSSIQHKKDKIKIPNILHDKIKSFKGVTNSQNPYIQELQEKYKDMKLLTLMRNDVTHNKAFQSWRQIIFFGQQTPSVLDENLAYIDILMPNYKKNGSFERSNEFNDFYTEQNSAVVFLINNYHKLFEIFETSLHSIKYDLIYLCSNDPNLSEKKFAIGFTYHENLKDFISLYNDGIPKHINLNKEKDFNKLNLILKVSDFKSRYLFSKIE